MKPEVMYEGIGQLDEFTPPEVLASVQEAGDKAWAKQAESVRRQGTTPIVVEKGENLAQAIERTRKKRADAGKPRPKPQPAPEPEKKAGWLTVEEATELNRLVAWEVGCQNALDRADRMLQQALSDRIAFIDSLAK